MVTLENQHSPRIGSLFDYSYIFHKSFFRKSPFCTFSCINPGFGGPWCTLWIFFLIAIFIMLQKNSFGQKKFQISCMGSKVPLWQNWKIAKMTLLNPCMKFKFFWLKDFFQGIMKVPFTKSIHNMPQGPSNPGFMQLKVQKEDFLKKPSRELKFFSCLRFLWIPWRPGTLN